ncbi:MAG: cell division control protein Cdc6 [Thermoplasmata archaeon]|nr:MAG: cell division control protein Cdc6 [Thermoplasmata archaeon]
MVGIFQKYLVESKIFTKNRDILRPSYVPDKLPHREREIRMIASVLATALRGERPSNILIFGKTGTGKTATVKYIGKEIENNESGAQVKYIYINCEVVDTNYSILANIGNTFIDKWAERIPFTGWPLESVYSKLLEVVDKAGMVVIVVLDEIDKLVYKSGDDVLYNLLTVNDYFESSKLSIIGISNDLKFVEFLDPRVRSRLGEEKIVFPPYNADELKDILKQRAEEAFLEGAISDEVISLCAALAAQEHGDARRALDLLRVAGELAERDGVDEVTKDYVYLAKNKIELDCIAEVIRTLPLHSKIVLAGVVLLKEAGHDKLTTGQVYDAYKIICGQLSLNPLTQRRITDIISELDMLGIINARVVSRGRYGRTKEIMLSVPSTDVKGIIEEDEVLREASRAVSVPIIRQITLI